MPKTMNINVHHVTRVEGHGNILVNVKNGRLEQCVFQIIEAPRYFESMLRGRSYDQASHLASRICGICAVTHATTSLLAVEKALGVEVSEQTHILRELNLFSEMIDSHVLHVYMLVAPDLLGVGSVIPLVKTNRGVVERALRMKKVAGDLCAIIGGRHTHPIAMQVGGFASFARDEEFDQIRDRLQAMRADLEETVALFVNLSFPEFERETEWIALGEDGNYPLLGGEIRSSDGGSWPVDAYREVTNEYTVEHSTAKHARHKRDSYMVGALARFNVNHASLHPEAKRAAEALSLEPGCCNPFLNTVAQVVELVHCCEMAIEKIDLLLERGVQPEKPAQPAQLSGEGVGACEAPRGTLYHHYELEEGLVVRADCVIPTAQNLANIEIDMRELVPGVLSRGRDEITHCLEMLVRAYDPCISCSTHMVKVQFDD
ncbi:MAG: Ni/Fe hydrogenase subunit alpha [Anaerolineales bacterium]|nr:Ni/Fe hydrogenase subunit alpha [Anaerolineales bacterium]